MSVEIIKQPPLRVTATELARLQDEYRKAFMFYAGPRPDFEEWAREKNCNAQRVSHEHRTAGD